MANKGRIRMLLSFSCFLVLMGHSYSQSDKLLQGGELKDGDELVSASGKFKLGFFTPSESPKSSERYIGVWYYKLKDRTSQYPEEDRRAHYTPQFQSTKVVWIANRNTPILHKSATLRIDSSDGNLKIFPNEENPIAITSVVAARNTSVTLEQSGNLVLRELHSNGSIKGMLWQSFDYPSDTFLPGMKLGINLKTGHKWFLRSWLTDDSPAQGRYTVGMDPNVTNQLTIWWREEIKGTSGPLLNGKFNSWDASGYNFSYTLNEQEKYFTYSVNEDITSYPMLQIDWDGSLVDDSSLPITPCSVSDEYCGSDQRFRMCNSNYYSFYYSLGMMSGDGTKFRESDNMTLDDCRLKCYKNCSCVAYAATNRENDTGCEIWSRGTKFKESNDGNSREIYVEHKRFAKKKWLTGVVIALAVATVALLVLLLCSWSDSARRTYKRNDNVSSYSTVNNEKDQATNHELKIFNFQTIVVATDNFSTANKLGEGGFGPVYKGKLPDGQEIAIKRLSRRSGQGIVEFNNETKLIAKLQHTNLVKLVGFSLQRGERILVYEYMHNKSLDFFIFDSDRKKLLDWKKRFHIIEGTAQGLIYLHKYSRLRVIHRDLKASNILLDDQLNPKISDFGMARIFGANESEANTNRVVGTFGYMSPEYAMNGIVSMKTDVFSFGVLVLEIVSGKKNNSCYHIERPLNLVGYAWQLWNEGKGLELIDTTLDQSCCPNDQVLRCLHVGLLCVQDQATDRPTISDVVSMLTNQTMLLPAPKQPAFFINVNSDEEQEASEIRLENCSTNDVTISELEAR